MYNWKCSRCDYTKNDSNCPTKKKTLYIKKLKSKIKISKI